jgi:hypothetical protein
MDAVPELSGLVIFDRRARDDRDTYHQRCADCWEWAEFYGYPIVDEVLAWGVESDGPRPAELYRAVRICQREHAGLLVHEQAQIDPWVVGELGAGGLPTFGVLDGRITVADNEVLACAPMPGAGFRFGPLPRWVP